MRTRRVLSKINYIFGIYVITISVLFMSTLSDVRELIEVNHWHGCSAYRDFDTYRNGGIASLALQAAAFLLSWLLLKSSYWKFAAITVGLTFIYMAVEFWWGTDCWQ